MSIDVGATPATAARSGRLRPPARKVAMIDGNEAAASVAYRVNEVCAICFEQCPCHAIEMIPEPSS